MAHIALHSNQISLQGTEVALCDYAHHNETLLGNRSLVPYRPEQPQQPGSIAQAANLQTTGKHDHHT